MNRALPSIVCTEAGLPTTVFSPKAPFWSKVSTKAGPEVIIDNAESATDRSLACTAEQSFEQSFRRWIRGIGKGEPRPQIFVVPRPEWLLAIAWPLGL